MFCCYLGFVYRECIENDQWGSWNVSECQTAEILRLKERTEEIYQQSVGGQTPIIQELQDIASQLVGVIDTPPPVFPSDIFFIADILDDLIS